MYNFCSVRESGQKIKWENCKPARPDATQNFIFFCAKETYGFIQVKFEHLQSEFFELLKTIYTTMNDGKTLNAVVSKVLKKYIASQCCYVCLTNSNEFNLETILNKDKNIDRSILKLGICSLHLWICGIEWVFNTARKLLEVKQASKIPQKQPRIY